MLLTKNNIYICSQLLPANNEEIINRKSFISDIALFLKKKRTILKFNMQMNVKIYLNFKMLNMWWLITM